MNVKTVVVMGLVCAAATLAGCARLHSKGDPSALTPGKAPGNVAHVAAVDRTAADSGVQLARVNPPDKRHHD